MTSLKQNLAVKINKQVRQQDATRGAVKTMCNNSAPLSTAAFPSLIVFLYRMQVVYRKIAIDNC